MSKAGKTRADLQFFQRHFTKPIDQDPEKIYKSNNRRFAFLSHGSLIAGSIVLSLLLATIAATAAITLGHRAAREATSKLLSPIRLAIGDNFPDPAIWLDNGTFYALATNNAAGILDKPGNVSSYEYGVSNVQIATSPDYRKWDLLNSSHDPLPTVGKWAPKGLTKLKPKIPKANVWAPAVIKRKMDNKFVLYYSADRDNATVPGGRYHPPPHCVGAAVSKTDSPAGPYEPAPNVLACQIERGGAIDPAAFEDTNGTIYLLWKVDGNNNGNGGLCGNTKAPMQPTPIMLQRMQPDGLTSDGEALDILDRIESDGPLVEAPSLIKSHEGIYFLFFSSGCTRSPIYDIKYATATKVEGPYRRAKFPLLETGDWGLLAPGSPSVHADGNGGFGMAFHARVSAKQGRIRAMFTTKLKFHDHTVRLIRDIAD